MATGAVAHKYLKQRINPCAELSAAVKTTDFSESGIVLIENKTAYLQTRMLFLCTPAVR